MASAIHYNANYYQLSKEFLREVTGVSATRGLWDIAGVWAELGALWLLALSLLPRETAWLWYVPIIFFIAGRQGALLQLVHEAAHGLLLKSKQGNHAAAKWGCALPIGVFFEGYTIGHRRHHAYTNTAKDPASDREKYRLTDFRNPRLYGLFLKDLCGLTALSIFFAYKKTEDEWEEETSASRLKSIPTLLLVQAILFFGIFQGSIVDYILFWIVPAVSPHMFLMRIRGIAEHGLPQQMGKMILLPSEGNLFTRSFGTPAKRYRWLPVVWLERTLIGSFRVYFHHEHHLFPSVPYYQLERIHRAIAPRVAEANPEVYASGYVAAALRGVQFPRELAMVKIPSAASP